jgi:PAS domain S-box-containing protein
MSGKCLFVNPAISALTGFTSAQLVGLQHILNAHPDDENRVAEQWKNVSRVGGVFFETYRFMHLSGKTIEVTVQAATVLDEQGKPSSVAGTMLAASKK